MNTKNEVQDALNNLIGDNNVPKNIRSRLGTILQGLDNTQDLHLKLNQSLADLDDISNDINLPPFVRTELFGVLSLLENMNSQLLTIPVKVKATLHKKHVINH
ncbi:MAG TPA: UPF0147 family protein [Candidatus Nanoarchaeia archaeon]|nr:UPF0147 family protein [Candidatus Nanoarchaeia archaeon]